MRILHIYKAYAPVIGGIENHIRILAEAQVNAGHEVTVLACGGRLFTSHRQLHGVTVIDAGRFFEAASMPVALSPFYLAARLRPDIMHVHSPYPLGEMAALIGKQDARLVVTYHSDIVRQKFALKFYQPLLRRFLRSADRIIATSPRYIDSSPFLNPLRDHCAVVPLGVDIHRFRPSEKSPESPPAALFVGRLRYYKGLETLFRALANVPHLKVSVVGDGPMKVAWSALTAKLGLTDRVTFIGQVSDRELPSVYHQFHFFVLPANARSEAFGTVLLEAMASGLPCISTEVGTGTSWVVEDGVTGLVVPPDNPSRLSKAMQLLTDDHTLRLQMGLAARDRTESQFSEQRMVEGVMAVYEALLP